MFSLDSLLHNKCMLKEPMTNLITIRDLHFAYGPKPIFTGVDMDMPQGSVIGIMGPSGTGKSTLLRLIGAQVLPSQGEVIFDSEQMASLSRTALYNARQKMGMLFQNSALFTHLSVFDNVAFPLREHTPLTEGMIRDLVLMKLELVGLRGATALMPSELSGGMMRRVALARAIALDPTLVMYDEPFTGLDPIAKGVIVKLIRQINDALGLTSIVVSHDVEDLLKISDLVYVVADGKVIGHGDPHAVQQDSNPQLKQFIQGLPDGTVPFHYPARAYKEDLLS